jgi:uncharacterized protein (DUF433 family)
MEPPDRITLDPANMNGQPCIRRLPVRQWDVYRDLAFYGIPDTEVLQKYPPLESRSSLKPQNTLIPFS